MDGLNNGFEYDDWEGEFPLPENIFKWDVNMIRWLAKKFQLDADNQSTDPSGDNQHVPIELPFQLWGYTGVQTGGGSIGADGGTMSAVFQIFIDGSQSNMITNFCDCIFADRDYSYINDRTYRLALEYWQNYDLQFPPNTPTSYFYYHFNYPDTRSLHFGNSRDNNYPLALYTFDDNNNRLFNCFSNGLNQVHMGYGWNMTTAGSYLSLEALNLQPNGTYNGFPVYSDWFRVSAFDDTMGNRNSRLPVSTNFTSFVIGGDDGDGLTSWNGTITNVYNTTHQQTTTYTTENGDTINIYQGDNNISISNHGNDLTFDDLYNIFNDTILPFVNTNQGTDITFPTYDEIKYVDMGDFYIEPLHQYDKLPQAPTFDGTIDLGDYPRVIGASANTFLSFLPASLSALLCAVFIIAIILDNLRGRR